MKVRQVRMMIAVGCLMLAACTAAQRPYSFQVASPNEDLSDRIVRALATNGQQVASVDPSAGVIYSMWQDTGFGYGSDRTIVRRYAVTLHPDPNGTLVVLRIDAKICPVGGYEIDGTLVTGQCSVMNEVVSDHQNDLDRLGDALRSSLGAGVVVTPRAAPQTTGASASQ